MITNKEASEAGDRVINMNMQEYGRVPLKRYNVAVKEGTFNVPAHFFVSDDEDGGDLTFFYIQKSVDGKRWTFTTQAVVKRKEIRWLKYEWADEVPPKK